MIEYEDLETEVETEVDVDVFEDEVEIDNSEIENILKKRVKTLSDSEIQKLEIQILTEFDKYDDDYDNLQKTGSKIDDYYIRREFLENKVDDLYALKLKYAECDKLDILLTREINRSNRILNKLIDKWG